ncbi:MAG TPA: aa3-type cytochrome c oxidase subunit IV [Caulobacteraceae bacterium]|nr:aa3-type cytochrome c oxidase subunit IV [Caulobacteraceae bacterium]
MSEAAHEHHPGDQDISEQIETFNDFGKAIKWGSLAIAVLILTLVIWFCVGAGFFSGIVSGLVLLAIGVFFLRSKPTPEH